MLIDSSFASTSSEDEEATDTTQLHIEERTNKAVQPAWSSNVDRYSALNTHLYDSSELKGYFFLPFTNGRIELVEIPKKKENIRHRIAQLANQANKFCIESSEFANLRMNAYNSKDSQNLREAQMNITQSRIKLNMNPRDLSEIVSRNDNNITVSNSMGSKSQQRKKRSPQVLLDRPIRTLKEVFKSIKKEIIKQKKQRQWDGSSVSSASEHSIEIEEEEDKDCNSDSEDEMDQAQRKKLENKMLNMMNWWNDIQQQKSSQANNSAKRVIEPVLSKGSKLRRKL